MNRGARNDWNGWEVGNATGAGRSRASEDFRERVRENLRESDRGGEVGDSVTLDTAAPRPAGVKLG